MRLGDLDALKEKLSDKNYITYTHEYGDAIPVEWVMNAIDNTPTIIWCSETSDGLPLMDLRPRPQGEWKLHGMIYYCSVCGHDYEQGGNNFCGNCGAKMKGGAE